MTKVKSKKWKPKQKWIESIKIDSKTEKNINILLPRLLKKKKGWRLNLTRRLEASLTKFEKLI